MKSNIILLLIFISLTVTSCTDFLFFGDSESSSNLSEMDLEEVAIAIDKEVGEAKARHVAQCEILPIGAKPCGGPWGYLVYSESASDESKLKKLIGRYNKLDEIRNIQEGRASTCDVAQPPDLVIEKATCKGEGPYAWNPEHILERNGIEVED